MKIFSLRQATIALLASTSLIALPAFGAEYTVSTPTIVTNGGAGNIDGDDKLTITQSGSITTTAPATDGVVANGANNIIVNAGSISTSGEFADGISVLKGSTVTNSGTISASGLGANGIDLLGTYNKVSNTGIINISGNARYGIHARDSNNLLENFGTINITSNTGAGIYGNDVNITANNFGTINVAQGDGILTLGNSFINNSGAIFTQGQGGGIVAGGNNITVSNSGTITTIGPNGYGIDARSGSTIDNSGVINTSEIRAMGISGTFGNTITNSGTINTTGAQAQGIIVTTESLGVTNTGIIHTTGVDAAGISVSSLNIITHSGYLVSEQYNSLHFGEVDNTLNLLAPAYIGGNMHLNSDTTVHVSTGRSHSNLWDFSDHGGAFDIDFTGPVPWAWDVASEQFATLDPTALSAAPDVLADKVGSLSDLIRMNRGNNSNADNMVAADLAVVQYQALITPPVEPAPPEPVAQYDGNWWLNGYGNFADYAASGIYNDYRNLSGGVAAGAAFVLNENLSLGAMIGFQASNLRVNSRWVTSQTINSNGIVGALYGNAQHENIFADLTLYAGWSANSSDRFVNDNLAPSGVAHALADYNSFFLAPELRVGIDIAADEDWTLTPSATARFSNQWVDGYTETGSNANATIGAHQVQVLEGEIELAATRQFDEGELTLRGGINYRQNLGAGTQDVVLLGQTLALPMNTTEAFGAFVGLGGSYEFTDDLSLDLAAKGTLRANGSFAIGGSIGVSGLF